MVTEPSETTVYHSVLPSPLLLHTSIQDSSFAKSGTRLCSALRKREMYIALLIV